jgi:hypothetical protein
MDDIEAKYIKRVFGIWPVESVPSPICEICDLDLIRHAVNSARRNTHNFWPFPRSWVLVNW